MTNKKLGNDFESAFCEILYSRDSGITTSLRTTGQPADVIAVRNGKDIPHRLQGVFERKIHIFQN